MKRALLILLCLCTSAFARTQFVTLMNVSQEDLNFYGPGAYGSYFFCKAGNQIWLPVEISSDSTGYLFLSLAGADGTPYYIDYEYSPEVPRIIVVDSGLVATAYDVLKYEQTPADMIGLGLALASPVCAWLLGSWVFRRGLGIGGIGED